VGWAFRGRCPRLLNGSPAGIDIAIEFFRSLLSPALAALKGDATSLDEMRMDWKDFLRRIFLIDLIKGLRLTFSYQRPDAIYTEQYPLERPPVAERYRGAPRLNNHPESGETLCIACNLCSLACPENLIVVGWARTEDRKKRLTTFTYDLSRCMFCGLCEDACPVDALELTQDFEIAHYSREGMIWDRQALEEGPKPARYTR
jgi:NADH-quinone oxidoreductase subunit I